jgi:uncharacterized membrane protein
VGVVGLLVFVALPRLLRHAFRIEPSEPAAERHLGRIQPLSVGLVVASFVLAIVAYGRHADGMPTPWDVIVFPFVVGFVWLSSMVWPRMSPLVGGEAAMRTYDGGEIAVLCVFLLAGILRFGALGPPMPLVHVSALCFGVLLMLGGNSMGQIPQNYFGGIRTPWTLTSQVVWLRTQRVGGKVTMLTGALIIVADRADVLRQRLLPILVSNVVIPMAYSYFLSRRLEGPKAG